LLTPECAFRESAILTCVENLAPFDTAFTVPLFSVMFEKICEVYNRPKKLALKEEDVLPAPQSRTTGKKMDNLIKVLFRPRKDRVRKSPLSEQEFMLLLRTICHP
jgi:hypothetical protein